MPFSYHLSFSYSVAPVNRVEKSVFFQLALKIVLTLVVVSVVLAILTCIIVLCVKVGEIRSFCSGNDISSEVLKSWK